MVLDLPEHGLSATLDCSKTELALADPAQVSTKPAPVVVALPPTSLQRSEVAIVTADTLSQEAHVAQAVDDAMLADIDNPTTMVTNSVEETSESAMAIDDTGPSNQSHGDRGGTAPPTATSVTASSTVPSAPVEQQLSDDVTRVSSQTSFQAPSVTPIATTESSESALAVKLPRLLYVTAGSKTPDVSDISFELEDVLAASAYRWANRHTIYEYVITRYIQRCPTTTAALPQPRQAG